MASGGRVRGLAAVGDEPGEHLPADQVVPDRVRAHPDEFEMPGITLDLVAFREGWAQKKQEKAAAAQSQV